MNFKHIPFIFREEDLKPVLGTLINGVQKRIHSAHEELVPKAGSIINDNTKEPQELLNILEKYLEVLQTSIGSVKYIMGSIVYDRDSGKENSPSDTKVVEDLPDLLEDSSGVD